MCKKNNIRFFAKPSVCGTMIAYNSLFIVNYDFKGELYTKEEFVMITRKTRLTSALLAVLMMMTMLAAYVLPVTAAEESSPYPYVRDMETLGRDYADDWGIGAAEDWITAIELNKNGETFNGKTLHFTADIDFDVDGDGEIDPEEEIDTLGTTDVPFQGNIHGHGHVIENLYIDHNVATEGNHAGLIGYSNKSGMVIRDLGLASGSVNMYGTSKTDENYSGAFMARGGSAVIFANCWTAIDVNGNIEGKELDMAPFGRGSGYTIVNCINTGDMNAKATTTGRTDAFLDWTTVATQVYNCVNMGNLNGTANYLFSFGSGTDTEAEYQQFVGNIGNIYVHNVYSDINKNGIDALLDYKTFEIDSNEYYSGELASKLNDNYVDKFDSLYGRKYFTMNEKGELAMTDDPYDALYKLTVSKQIGDYAVSSETSFEKATSTINLPVYEGYVLDSHTDAIMPDYDANTFRMPPMNAELNYVASVPDWNIIKELIDEYEGMVESGHAKALNDAAALSELLDKLKLSYAAKDTMSDEQAMARIALYVKDNANLDLSIKENLVYPNYPLMRYFDKTVSKVWGIKDLEDWQAAVAISEEEKETFNGITIHFLNDVDFKNVPVNPLCSVAAFTGTIDGHDHAIHNLLIDQDAATSTYTALIGRVATGCVVKNLGIESGEIRLTGTGNQASGTKYVGIFTSQGSGSSVFANCWSNADVNVDVKQYEIDCAPFGRNSATTKIINFIGNGDINVKIDAGGDKGTARADATLDWSAGTTINLANIGYTGNIHTEGGVNNMSYVVGLATTTTFKGITKDQLHNIYGNGKTGFSAKSDVNEWFADAGFTADQVTSGELAWKMNNGYYDGYDDTYGHKYYTVKDGKLAFGTESEQPVRINVKSGDSAVYLYGFPGDTFDLNDLFSVGAPSFKVKESYAASIDANKVLTINSLPNELEINVEATFEEGLDFVALGEAIAAYDGESNLDKYASNMTDLSLSAKLAEVQNKTYTTQAEIDKDVEILESYYYAIPITQYNTNPNADMYTVASKADMDHLKTIYSLLTVDQTIVLSADIDMENTDVRLEGLAASIDGGNHYIKGLKLSGGAFLGNYAGKLVKDLTIKDSSMTHNASGYGFLIAKVTVTNQLDNVTLDNVTYTCNKSSTSGIQGLMIGQISGGTLIANNIAVINSTMVRPAGSTYWNSGLVIGKTYKGKIVIDGLYVNNNTISGNATAGGTGVAFGELICDTSIKNAIVTNNTASYIRGVFSSMVKEGSASSSNPVDPEINIENVITYNNNITFANDSYNDCIGTAANEGKGTTITNVYTDNDSVLSATDASIVLTNGNANAADAIKSGEAAYVVNATEPNVTVAMKNNMPVFSETGLPVKVTLDVLLGDDVVLYTDVNGKLIGLTDDLAARFWTGYDDLANAVFTEDTTVVQSECNHNYVYTAIPHNPVKHTLVCTTPNGCGSNVIELCTFEYIREDGITHIKVCIYCGNGAIVNCNNEMTHVNGTYGQDSKHVEVCEDCGYSTESACSFTENKVAHTNLLKGYTEYTCECGYSYIEEEATKAHEFGNVAVTVKAPTYTEAGTAKYKCSICDAYEYREIPALTGTGINVNAPVSAMQGEEITVELELANNAGNVAGMNLQVNYDDAVFSLVNVVDNGIFDQAILPETATSGKVNLTYANVGNLTADETDGKALATLTFKVLDEAAYGNTEITAEFVKSEALGDTGAVDYDSNFITIGEGSAVVGIMAYLWGDANMDGNVNVADAQTILQWRVGKEVAIDLTAADADRNGEVTIADALLLLQYANQMVEWDPYGTTAKPASVI